MVFRTTPQLGPQLEVIIPAGEVWFDVPGKGAIFSPQLGVKEFGSDGRVYIPVVAGADLNANAQLTIDGATWEATTGSDGYYVQGKNVPKGAFFWARKGSL